MEIKMSTYCNWNTDARQVNFKHEGRTILSLYFSYKTLIGVVTLAESITIQNYWGSTTGRHLNQFSTKEERIPSDDFDKISKRLIADTLGGLK